MVAPAPTLVAWSSATWEGEARVLLVGGRATVRQESHTFIDAPTSLGQLRGALGTPQDLFDSALVSDWGRGIELYELVDSVRRSVRTGGTVAIVAPVAQIGWRGARGAVLGLIRRQRPVPLEDLCGALLRAHLVDIRARPLEGAGGDFVVWATVPPRWREDVESSAVVPSTDY